MIHVRARRATDTPGLPQLLAAAFAHYRDALVYSPAVLALFDATWWADDASVVAVERRHGTERLVGACLAGRRTATLAGHSVTVAHVGPVAVVPDRWHHGVGTALLRAVHARAETDLATLTINRVEDVGAFYQRSGYTDVEFWTPQARNPRDERSGPRVDAPWRSDGLLVEQAAPLPDCEAPRVRRFADGRLQTVLWTVTSRQGGALRTLHTCQVVERIGDDLDGALEQATAQAARDGARLIWGRPQLVHGLRGFRQTPGPGVARMARPLSDLGRRLFPSLRGWKPAGPSP